MGERDSEFDDPALRAAVRRTMGGGTAPPSLRWKVAAMLTESGGAGQGAEVARSEVARSKNARSTRGTIGSSRFKVLAAAAVMLVGIGVMVIQIRSQFFPPVMTGGIPGSPFASAAVDMVHTHDQCTKLADHHFIAGDDLAALGAKLSAEQHIPVFSASPGPAWKFKGAGLCQVGSISAAHFIFVRADASVSIFSLSSFSLCYDKPSDDYHQTIDRHPVAGIYRGGALYCVVGSRTTGEMKLSEIEPILAKVSATMTAGNVNNAASTIATATTSH